jgi:hypothetical protein
MKLHHLAVAPYVSATSTIALADSLHGFPHLQPNGTPSITVASRPVHGGQTPAPQAAPIAKTRQHVTQESMQVERDGLVPTSRSDHLPIGPLIELTKERHAAGRHFAQGKQSNVTADLI